MLFVIAIIMTQMVITEGVHAQTNKGLTASNFNIGVGVGNEYGGYGLAIQYPLNESMSLTAGLGTNPGDNELFVGYSFGVKIFRNMAYLAAQFSQFGVASVSGSGVTNREDPVFGPSLIAGYTYPIYDNLIIDGGIGVYININDKGASDDWSLLPGMQIGLKYRLN